MRGSKQFRVHISFAVVVLAGLLAPAVARADFGLQSMSATAFNADNSVDLQAGSHPFTYELNFAMNRDAENHPEGSLRDVIVELPAGFVGNPQAVPHCDTATFEGQISACPGSTQVGIVETTCCGGLEFVLPLYNLTPPLGSLVRLGFSVTSKNIFQDGSLRPSDYGVDIGAVSIPNVELQTAKVTVWGVPADKAHNSRRLCFEEGSAVEGCSTDSPKLPFITLPTSCGGPIPTTVQVDSVENPGVFDSKTVFTRNQEGQEAGLENCSAPPFQPTITVEPETSAADSASGLHVDLHVPQTENPDQLATANLKNAVVTLPAGLAVNASAADGLGACPLEGSEGINLPKSSDPTVPEPAAVGEPAKCPANSKVGTVQVKTPALDHPVPGGVYLAKQEENPFGSLLALYVALDDPISGVIAKVAGEVDLNETTGQLKATFENNPQLPFEDLEFSFFGGPRANLTTPPTCGSYPTSAELTPWTTPEGATVTRTSSFAVTGNPSGGPCAHSESEKPNGPSFEAGTVTPLAGSYSPFVLKMSRENGSQHFGTVNVTLPKGVAAKFAGVQECSEALIAQATARSKPGEGALELAQPSCPQGSQLGTVTVGAGSGAPFYVQGRAYLAGPYKGAPYSVVFITPAVAGPFDLGTVVVRAALYVDENTAQGTIKSDPFPTILQGIPLEVRSVAVHIDRKEFTLNPTSCEAMAVSGQEISTAGAVAPLENRFQVGGCGGLPFSPKIALSFKGGTKRTSHPSVQAVLTRPEGQANFGRVSVMLPSTEFIDQAHIGNPCTRPRFAESKCPRISELGTVKAYTPLLEKPLTGKVYFRANGGERVLPDLVADLRGQIHFVLVGFVDSVHKKGSEQSRVRTTFAQNPDAPVSKVVLQLYGGKRGTIINSQNLCKTKVPQTAVVKMTGQNGKVHDSEPKIANDCSKKSRSR